MSIFQENLAKTLGCSPSVEVCEQLLGIAQQVNATNDHFLAQALRASVSVSPSSLWGVLDRHGLLKAAILPDALVQAFDMSNTAWIMRAKENEHVKALVQTEEGLAIYRRLFSSHRGNAQEAPLRFLNAFDWSNARLDQLLVFTLQNAPIASKLPHETLSWLIRKGANPLLVPQGKIEQGIPVLGQLIKSLANCTQEAQQDILQALLYSPFWPEMVERKVFKKSVPFALLNARAPLAGVVDALDRVQARWWDGDPYGLMEYGLTQAIKNVRSRQIQAPVLAVMADRARKEGVEKGLHHQSLTYMFCHLFEGMAKDGTSPDTRAEFWKTVAPGLASLWAGACGWAAMSLAAADFEKTQGNTATIAQRRAFVEAIQLHATTGQAPSPIKRRTL